MIIIDTCSWLKIEQLEKLHILKLRDFLYRGDLWATNALIKEYSYHLEDFLDPSKFSIQKVDIKPTKDFLDEGFDEADLSLMAFGRKYPQSFIISDDGPALNALLMFKLTVYRLSEYILFLVDSNILDKTLAITTIKSLRNWKNIKEKAKKKIIDLINQSS